MRAEILGYSVDPPIYQQILYSRAACRNIHAYELLTAYNGYILYPLLCIKVCVVSVEIYQANVVYFVFAAFKTYLYSKHN